MVLFYLTGLICTWGVLVTSLNWYPESDHKFSMQFCSLWCGFSDFDFQFNIPDWTNPTWRGSSYPKGSLDSSFHKNFAFENSINKLWVGWFYLLFSRYIARDWIWTVFQLYRKLSEFAKIDLPFYPSVQESNHLFTRLFSAKQHGKGAHKQTINHANKENYFSRAKCTLLRSLLAARRWNETTDSFTKGETLITSIQLCLLC